MALWKSGFCPWKNPLNHAKSTLGLFRIYFPHSNYQQECILYFQTHPYMKTCENIDSIGWFKETSWPETMFLFLQKIWGFSGFDFSHTKPMIDIDQKIWTIHIWGMHIHNYELSEKSLEIRGVNGKIIYKWKMFHDFPLRCLITGSDPGFQYPHCNFPYNIMGSDPQYIRFLTFDFVRNPPYKIISYPNP